MAPLASDPRQILIVLNLARRKALFTVIEEIVAYMRTQLELRDAATSPASASLLSTREPSSGSISSGSEFAPSAEVPVSQRATKPTPELIRLRQAAIEDLDHWRKEALAKVKELLSTPDDAKILEARRARTDEMEKRRREQPEAGEDLLVGFGGSSSSSSSTGDMTAHAEHRKREVASLQALYHAIPTRLVTIPAEDREQALSCILLLLLSTGHYSAYARTIAVYLASALALPLTVLDREETEIAKSLVEASTSPEAQEQAKEMSAETEAQKRREEGKSSRFWKVGLASVAGAAIIGVTGGLAAPVVAGAIGGLMTGVGLGGVASFLGIFWMNGALVGTLFGAFGAKMTGEMMDQYAREVEDFRFLPLKEEWGGKFKKDNADARRLRVNIGINGWLKSKEDVTKPWRSLGDESEVFALRYEMNSLVALGTSLDNMVQSAAWSVMKYEILKRTVLATLWSALWPAWLMKEVASSIDNPFNLAKNRSEKAGRILADALINKVQGERPVTLIGYSLGARVIYATLRSLVQRRAFGLVDSVVLIGAPVPSNRQHWLMMRSVVTGKMFNVYSENDYVLAFMYRATSAQLGVAGLQAIRDIEGVENLDLSQEVQGHLRYPELIGKILTRCGFPDIKGGDGPIEKDKDFDEIHMKDEDRSKTGTLIDFGGLALEDKVKPAETNEMKRNDVPTRAATTGPVGMSKEADSKVRSTVTRAKSDTVIVDPLGTREVSAPASEPRRDLLSTNRSGESSQSQGTTPSGTEHEAVRMSAPRYSVSQHYNHQEIDNSDKDEDSYVGIQMRDDDDDGLAFAEPTPVEN